MKKLLYPLLVVLMCITSCNKGIRDDLVPKDVPRCGTQLTAKFIEKQNELMAKIRLGGPWLDYNNHRPRIFFLNFEGETLDGTIWNNDGPFTCQPSGLTQSQKDSIVDAVQSVYLPWNVYVTADRVEFETIKGKFRHELLVTKITGVPLPPAGGYAMIGALYEQEQFIPSFVFADLWAYNVHNIIGAVVHELGHAVGLYHQMQGSVQYPVEYGTNFSVGTIMANFANADLSVWRIGQSEPGLPQDDIQWCNDHLNPRPDDHENIISPTTMQLGANTWLPIVLNDFADTDMIYIPSNTCTIEVVSSMVDVQIVLHKPNGVIVGTPIDPPTSLGIPPTVISIPGTTGLYLEISVSPYTGTAVNPTPTNTVRGGIKIKRT